MKLLILSLCVACAIADVSHILPKHGDESKASIVEQTLDMQPDGNYASTYLTDNGISGREAGSLKDVGAENPVLSVQGNAEWTAPDGQKVSLEYIADENGYQPQGAFIPTPPPIPEAIARALEWLRAHHSPPERP